MKKVLIVGLKDPAGGVESAVMEQVRHLDTNEVRADFALFTENFSFEQEITERGGRVIYFPSRVTARREYKAALKAAFETEKYDAVWCNFSGLTNIDFLKEARRAGVGCRIAHAHTAQFAWGNILMKYLVPMLHYKNQRVIDKAATKLWACSPAAAEFMFGKKNLSKTEIVNNPVDTEKYVKNEAVRREVRAEFSITDEKVIIHVGRMCVAKNQKFLLDIFSQVLKLDPSARLLFVGDGELQDEIMSYAEQFSFGSSVIFTGARRDVPRLLQAADAFLLPSVTEGLPVTAVEAQAAGLCCVVSKEAVPPMTDVTGNVRFLSLADHPSVWAGEVLKATECAVSDGAERVAKGGYGLKENVERLQKVFMEA